MKRKISLLIILSILLMVLDKFSLLGPVRNIGGTIMLPVVRPFVWVGNTVQTGVNVLTFFKSGEQRIKNLEQRNWELNSLAAKNQQLQSENDLLKNQLGIKLTKKFKLIPATVLTKAQHWTIDKGTADGVAVDMVVSVGGNLVGKVVKSDSKISYLATIFDPNLVMAVIVNDVRGEVRGKFGTTAVLTKINQDEKILIDDVVYTVDGIMVGKVGDKKSKLSDIFGEYEIKSNLDFSHINEVLLLANE